ncbi:MAG: hypothetical protein ACRECW_08175 [Phyllobacterium sp.]
MTPHPLEPQIVHLIVADVWLKANSEPTAVHILLTESNVDGDDIVTAALKILANEGYEEAELQEIGQLDGEPEEEPHKSAWKTALSGQVALIEFGNDEEGL